MTILYRPVLIETVEQAEALPEDALILRIHDSTGEGTWTRAQGPPFPASWLPVQALVPVEAEEVYAAARGLVEPDINGREDLNRDAPERRLYRRTEFHTPWEEA